LIYRPEAELGSFLRKLAWPRSFFKLLIAKEPMLPPYRVLSIAEGVLRFELAGYTAGSNFLIDPVGSFE